MPSHNTPVRLRKKSLTIGIRFCACKITQNPHELRDAVQSVFKL